MRTKSKLSSITLAIVSSAFLSLVMAGCAGQATSDQEIREKSAQATREARQGAKDLAAGTKVAAAKAVDGVNAVTQGIQDGMKGKPGDKVDINSATTARLALLPGVSLSQAVDVVKERPYSKSHDLVTRGLLTQKQYDRIAANITAK